VVTIRGIPSAEVRRVARAMHDAVPGGAFALETAAGFCREPAYRPRWPGSEGPVAPLDELLARTPVVLKMLYRLDRGTADDMLAAARAALQGLAEPVHSDASDSLLEIAALGVSKASTLAVLAEQQGLGPQDGSAKLGKKNVKRISPSKVFGLPRGLVVKKAAPSAA